MTLCWLVEAPACRTDSVVLKSAAGHCIHHGKQLCCLPMHETFLSLLAEITAYSKAAEYHEVQAIAAVLSAQHLHAALSGSFSKIHRYSAMQILSAMSFTRCEGSRSDGVEWVISSPCHSHVYVRDSRHTEGDKIDDAPIQAVDNLHISSFALPLCLQTCDWLRASNADSWYIWSRWRAVMSTVLTRGCLLLACAEPCIEPFTLSLKGVAGAESMTCRPAVPAFRASCMLVNSHLACLVLWILRALDPLTCIQALYRQRYPP